MSTDDASGNDCTDSVVDSVAEVTSVKVSSCFEGISYISSAEVDSNFPAEDLSIYPESRCFRDMTVAVSISLVDLA